jgi:hypothetical protein
MKRMNLAGPQSTQERRGRAERRHRVWWSVFYGNFRPRRRTPSRRDGDFHYRPLDWHSAHLLAVAIGILLLCVLDAFLTLVLLERGAAEVNPVMALLVERHVTAFAGLKMSMTSLSIVFMVFLSRYRFMRLLPVAWVLYGVLIAYVSLIAWEIYLLRDPLSIL